MFASKLFTLIFVASILIVNGDHSKVGQRQFPVQQEEYHHVQPQAPTIYGTKTVHKTLPTYETKGQRKFHPQEPIVQTPVVTKTVERALPTFETKGGARKFPVQQEEYHHPKPIVPIPFVTKTVQKAIVQIPFVTKTVQRAVPSYGVKGYGERKVALPAPVATKTIQRVVPIATKGGERKIPFVQHEVHHKVHQVVLPVATKTVQRELPTYPIKGVQQKVAVQEKFHQEPLVQTPIATKTVQKTLPTYEVKGQKHLPVPVEEFHPEPQAPIFESSRKTVYPIKGKEVVHESVKTVKSAPRVVSPIVGTNKGALLSPVHRKSV